MVENVSDRRTYQAIARRVGGWWAIEVPEVPGAFTQTRRLDQVDTMAREVISLMLDTARNGLPLRDIGSLLGVSFQRAQQLVGQSALLDKLPRLDSNQQPAG